MDLKSGNLPGGQQGFLRALQDALSGQTGAKTPAGVGRPATTTSRPQAGSGIDRLTATNSGAAASPLAGLVSRGGLSGQATASASSQELASAGTLYEPASGLGATGTSSSTGANAAAKAGDSLTVDSDTTPAALTQFLDAPTGARPKIAITQEGAAYLVLGTYQDPSSGKTMVRTANPNNGLGGSSALPLDQFQKNVAVVQNSQTQPNTALQVPSSSQLAPLLQNAPGLQADDQVTFNGYYQDPNTQAVMASLTDNTQGTHVNVDSGTFANLFGAQSQQALHDSLSGSAQSAFKMRGTGGESGDGYSISPNSKPADMDSWLQGNKTPMLTDNKDGSRSLVQAGAAGSGQVTVTPLSPASAGPTNLSTADFMAQTNYVDRATAGQGTSFTAQASAGGLTAGQAYTLQGLSSAANGGVQVQLQDSGGKTYTPSLAQAQQALGSAGMTNLIDSAQTNPLGPNDKRTYSDTSSSELFDPGAGSQASVSQGQVGDCYFESTLSGLEKQDPNYLQNMVRPSQDGNPDHVDVRFYAPSTTAGQSGQPVWITVNKQLPINDQGKNTSSQVTPGKDGIPDVGPALIEKAYVEFNQQYHVNTPTGGYAGINGGSPSQAMQSLTGQASPPPVSINSTDLLSTLQSTSQGKVVILGTQAGNTPSPGLDSNIIADHAYTVLGTSVDAQGQDNVTLRNPWGKNTDTNGTAIPDTNGEFTIPVADLPKYFAWAIASGGSEATTQPA